VVVRVLVAADGTAAQATLGQTSGYQRLDQAALSAVMAWRYQPGKRSGAPEPMWLDVPVDFVLD
jgi:protein TonB